LIILLFHFALWPAVALIFEVLPPPPPERAKVPCPEMAVVLQDDARYALRVGIRTEAVPE